MKEYHPTAAEHPLIEEAKSASAALRQRSLQGVWIPGVPNDDQRLADLIDRMISALNSRM